MYADALSAFRAWTLWKSIFAKASIALSRAIRKFAALKLIEIENINSSFCSATGLAKQTKLPDQ